MAKKRRTPPTPKMPDRVEHYYRAFREDTADGLEAILTESRKTAKRLKIQNPVRFFRADNIRPYGLAQIYTFYNVIIPQKPV